MRLKIPKYAKEEARRALELRRSLPASKKFGITNNEAKKLGIASGVERAKQIMQRKYLPQSDTKRVAAFYQRFKGCKTPKCEGAIGLWGGRKFGKIAVDHINKMKGGSKK